MFPTPHEIIEHIQVETSALKLIAKAVQDSLDWEASEDQQSRKASLLRQVAATYAMQLTRLFGIEEQAVDTFDLANDHPELIAHYEGLIDEHAKLRDEANRISLRLDVASYPADRGPIEEAYHDLRTLLARVEQHNLREMDLVQLAWTQDTGGGD